MRDEIIASIKKIQDELATYDVRREYVNFKPLDDGDLIELEESFAAQLKQKKNFLGENL